MTPATTIKQMRYFLATADLGSFSLAARHLNVAQPAVSRQVRMLEENHGVLLFERNGRGVFLTDAGARFAERCRGIIVQVKRAEEELVVAHKAVPNSLTLGMPSSVLSYFGVPFALRLRSAYPDLHLSLPTGRSTELQLALTSGSCDVALIYDTSRLTSVTATPVARDRLVLLSPPGTSPGSAVSLATLADRDFVLRRYPNLIRHAFERALTQNEIHPRIAMEVSDGPAIVELVSSGIGTGVMSSLAAKSYADRFRVDISEITDPEIALTLHIVHPIELRGQADARRLRIVQEITRDVLASLGAERPSSPELAIHEIEEFHPL